MGGCSSKNSLRPAGLAMLSVHKQIPSFSSCDGLLLSLLPSVTQPPYQTVKPSVQGLERGPLLLSCFRPEESLFPTSYTHLRAFKMWTQLLSERTCPASQGAVGLVTSSRQSTGCPKADLLATVTPSLDTHPGVLPHTHTH